MTYNLDFFLLHLHCYCCCFYYCCWRKVFIFIGTIKSSSIFIIIAQNRLSQIFVFLCYFLFIWKRKNLAHISKGNDTGNMKVWGFEDRLKKMFTKFLLCSNIFSLHCQSQTILKYLFFGSVLPHKKNYMPTNEPEPNVIYNSFLASDRLMKAISILSEVSVNRQPLII